ncbi:hypothetical protein EON65_25515 [archaeon]|nr:MAG: hypothetical protein EON65_25515 [archaeon]
MNIISISICIVAAWLGRVAASYDWSFQQRLIVSEETSGTYGITPPALFGRGFLTLITGFDGSSSSPGIYVHTTDDGYVRNGQYVWSQQAKLLPKDIQAGDGFGSYMLATNNTLLISSPAAEFSRGVIYVFNGTLRHWSQIQRLSSPEPQANERFGERMTLYHNKLLIGAKGTNRQLVTSGGSVYVYARPSTGIYWSRQGKLFPRDTITNQFFGETLSMFDNLAVVSARNDDAETDTGSAYIFQETNSLWSQQQKLIALDMQNYRLGVQLDVCVLLFCLQYVKFIGVSAFVCVVSPHCTFVWRASEICPI